MQSECSPEQTVKMHINNSTNRKSGPVWDCESLTRSPFPRGTFLYSQTFRRRCRTVQVYGDSCRRTLLRRRIVRACEQHTLYVSIRFRLVIGYLSCQRRAYMITLILTNCRFSVLTMDLPDGRERAELWVLREQRPVRHLSNRNINN